MALQQVMKPHWLILGPEASWITALEQGGIWGVKSPLYPEWKALDPGDMIFFFPTKPVSGVIGAARVNNKFIQDKPLWPDEIAERKVIYPYRFDFSIEYVLEQPRWRKDRLKVPLAIQEMRRGISLLLERTVEMLYAAFADQFHYNLLRAAVANPPMPSVAEVAQAPGTHRRMQDLLFEIGNLNRLVCEKEYPMESERLDVVWRRVERSVPTYAFEIQVGGDIYHALGKLKHAHDLWNSNIFLVASETEKESVSQLLAGTFHEIEKVLRTLSPEVVRDLHEKKRKWVDLERSVGLL